MIPARVLMTADAVGGVWTYALELARGLTAAGAKVLLAVVGPAPDSAQRAEAEGIADVELRVTGLPLEWQDRAGPLTAAQAGLLLELERSFRPDLVHCNGFREAAAGFAAPVLVVAHSCVATWWRACRGEELPDGWAAYARGVRAGLGAAAALTAPTAAFMGDFQSAWKTVPPTFVVPNGLDLEPAPTGRRRPVVLAAGRLWDEAKNVAALAAVAPDLPWTVVVAGEADRRDGPLRYLGNLSRDALRRRMGEAAIFAAPARYEPFGLAILEAAAAGCALVLGRQSSLTELWQDAARFVPADDPASLRATLLELIGDPAAQDELGQAAKRRAARFSGGRMAADYHAVYAGILRERSGARVRAA